MTHTNTATVDPTFDGASHPSDTSRPLYGASFSQATRRFFNNYAKFSGRASRSEYWFAQLMLLLLSLIPWVLILIGFTITAATIQPSGSVNGTTEYVSAGAGVGLVFLIIGGIVGFVVWAAILVPSFALGWRRMHDANLAGPMYLFTFVPSVGSIIVIVLACLGSKPQGRRFDTPVTV